MRLKSRAMLVIGCVSLLAMSVPAFSIPAPRVEQAVNKKKFAQAASKKNAKPQAARDNRAGRLASMPIAEPPKQPLLGWPVLVREARKYIGTNPTARTRLWCATFMNLVLAKSGYAGTNSDAAKSFAYYGHRVVEPQIGAIALLTRGNKGGHVSVVSGIDSHGNPIIISGNHGRRVGEATYPRSRVTAYVMPTDQRLAGHPGCRHGAKSSRSKHGAECAVRPQSCVVRVGHRFPDYRTAGGDRGRAQSRRGQAASSPAGRAAGTAGGTADAASRRAADAGADSAAAG